jgi:hypothetical protein
MVKKKVRRSDCLTIPLALSLSPAPLYLATIAVAPTFMDMTIDIRRNLGCVERPTAEIA